MLRSLLIAVFALTSLMGCARTAEIGPSDDVPSDGVDDDGTMSIAIGQTFHVRVYGNQSGYDVEPFACDGSPILTASDPTLLAIAPAPKEEEEWNSFDGLVAAFAITGLREGDVVLTTECNGLPASETVHVHL